jgi:hypothetical protein
MFSVSDHRSFVQDSQEAFPDPCTLVTFQLPWWWQITKPGVESSLLISCSELESGLCPEWALEIICSNITFLKAKKLKPRSLRHLLIQVHTANKWGLKSRSSGSKSSVISLFTHIHNHGHMLGTLGVLLYSPFHSSLHQPGLENKYYIPFYQWRGWGSGRPREIIHDLAELL